MIRPPYLLRRLSGRARCTLAGRHHFVNPAVHAMCICPRSGTAWCARCRRWIRLPRLVTP